MTVLQVVKCYEIDIDLFYYYIYIYSIKTHIALERIKKHNSLQKKFGQKKHISVGFDLHIYLHIFFCVFFPQYTLFHLP